MYTNRQLLHVFSSTTTEVIKRGVLLEGVCMIDSNQNNDLMALLTLKGVIHVLQIQSVDGGGEPVKPYYKAEIQSLLKSQQTKMLLANQTSDEPKVISVQHLRILDSGDIDLILSNKSRFQYDSKTLHQWVMKPKFLSFDQL